MLWHFVDPSICNVLPLQEGHEIFIVIYLVPKPVISLIQPSNCNEISYFEDSRANVIPFMTSVEYRKAFDVSVLVCIKLTMKNKFICQVPHCVQKE